jgi:hypothetical protein
VQFGSNYNTESLSISAIKNSTLVILCTCVLLQLYSVFYILYSVLYVVSLWDFLGPPYPMTPPPPSPTGTKLIHVVI